MRVETVSMSKIFVTFVSCKSHTNEVSVFWARAPVPLLPLAEMPGWHTCEGPWGTLGLCFWVLPFCYFRPGLACLVAQRLLASEAWRINST